MQVSIDKKENVNAKTLRLHLKPRDEFYASIEDENGKELIDYEGYVPDFMPGEHFGDYLFLDIDLETGQIKNWKKPTSEQISNFINQADE